LVTDVVWLLINLMYVEVKVLYDHFFLCTWSSMNRV
jgi:hypothetical protein